MLGVSGVVEIVFFKEGVVRRIEGLGLRLGV